jgi:hypothetical protein
MENFLAKPIKEASFSSPVRIIGWNELPTVGSKLRFLLQKKKLSRHIEELKNNKIKNINLA